MSWHNKLLLYIVRVLMPEQMKRLFYITTLFNYLIIKCECEISYTRLYLLCTELTPSRDTFSLPALFWDRVWGKSILASITKQDIIGNKITLEDIELSTPNWIRYAPNTDIMKNDTLMVFKVVLMEYNDPENHPEEISDEHNVAGE